MQNYDRQDMELTAVVELPATASKTVTSEKVIDITSTGGIDECRLVITCPKLDKSGASATLSVLGSDVENGEFSAVPGLTLTASATTVSELRERLPLRCPRYLKLQGVTGSTATTAPTRATLSIRV